MNKQISPRKNNTTYAVVYMMIAFRKLSKINIQNALITKKIGRI